MATIDLRQKLRPSGAILHAHLALSRLFDLDVAEKTMHDPTTLDLLLRVRFAAQGGIRAVTLCEQLQKSASHISRLVERAEAARLVERRADPSDRRAQLMINIYYVETVSGSSTTGRAVGFSDFIILGQNFGDIAVVHEVGHSFSARHKSAPDFNTECIMWPFYNTSDPCEYFSEGELFRMHVNTDSALNINTYNARPGQPTVACVGNVSSDVCVDWDKRLWDDGTLLAN